MKTCYLLLLILLLSCHSTKTAYTYSGANPRLTTDILWNDGYNGQSFDIDSYGKLTPVNSSGMRMKYLPTSGLTSALYPTDTFKMEIGAGNQPVIIWKVEK